MICRVRSILAGLVMISGSFALPAGAAMPADDSYSFSDVRDADKAAAVQELGSHLKYLKPPSILRHCSILVGAYPAQLETIYGGACDLQKGGSVVICADTGVGNFGMSKSLNPTRASVIRYAQKNCVGG